MYRLSEEEIEEILEGNELCALKNILYFSRPNYFQLLYQQDKSIVDEVFEKVKWELASYPSAHRHYFYNFIATYLAINGHQGKAEEYFLEAIRVKPSSEVTLSNYVILLCETGNREKTAIYFKRLNELKQGSPEVKLDLAILFQLFNLNVAARVLLDDYVSRSANVNDFIMFLFGRVLLEHSLGKMMYDSSIEKAIKIFHDINRRSPKFLPNIDLLVKSLNQKWKISQKTNKNPHPYSIFIASKVNWSECCHSHAFYLHGKIRMRIGEMDEAKNALLRSVELTHNTHNHYQLGKCYMALSEVQEAGMHFSGAQNLTRTYCVKFVLLEGYQPRSYGKTFGWVEADYTERWNNSNLS
ncbi:uncharacterized protein LOC134823887 [Bolinopsis microptera]|uniref:uncharacterized protein LOC134823887 n=1 Tax=Bolinopsis microptera TaxID=2820187 RepID=UPI003079EDC3